MDLQEKKGISKALTHVYVLVMFCNSNHVEGSEIIAGEGESEHFPLTNDSFLTSH